MDYKLLIILLALLFLIILVYREVSSLRQNILKNISSMLFNTKQNQDKIVNNLQNNMSKCILQIKEITNDNIQQFRKINTLNHQPITKVANHYTEMEDSDFHTDIHYLSDSRKSRKRNTENVSRSSAVKKSIFQQKQNVNNNAHNSNNIKDLRNTDYYMSEDNTRNTNESKVICDGDVCYKVMEIPMYTAPQIERQQNNSYIVDEDTILITPNIPPDFTEMEIDIFNIISGNLLLPDFNAHMFGTESDDNQINSYMFIEEHVSNEPMSKDEERDSVNRVTIMELDESPEVKLSNHKEIPAIIPIERDFKAVQREPIAVEEPTEKEDIDREKNIEIVASNVLGSKEDNVTNEVHEPDSNSNMNRFQFEILCQTFL